MSAAPLALIVRVGERVLALDPGAVEGVAKRPQLTRVPLAPPSLAGLGAVRGRTTAVIDLGEGGGELVLLRGEAAALAVDRVEGLRPAGEAERFDPAQALAGIFQARAARPAASAPAPAPRRGEVERSFLEFALAGQRFAFPLDEVRAVIPAAEPVPVPEADPAVRGLVPYGEGALPVVDLARLLGMATGTGRRLIVVEIGGAAVGLEVGQVFGALRLPARAVTPAPAALNRGRGEARVAAIARIGAGLVAVLAADRLFDEETTRRLQSLAPATRPRAPAAVAHASEAVLLFRLGAERYALPAETVEAVARAPELLTPPPQAPSFLTGLMPHRGVALPLLDLADRFKPSSPLLRERRAVIVLRHHEISAGLLVDAVERLARLPRVEAAPPLLGDAGALFARTALADGTPLLLTDADALLGRALRDLRAWR